MKSVKSRRPQRGHARARTDVWHAEFLRALAEQGNVTAAAKAAGVDPMTVRNRRKTDETFAAVYDVALEAAADALEAEAWRRGKEGVERPVTVAQQAVIIREYSDTLLLALLRAHRPEKFRERHEVTGKDGGPVTIRVVYDEPKEERPS